MSTLLMKYRNTRVYYASLVANIGGMTLGYDTGVGGGVITLPSFQNTFLGRHPHNPTAVARLSSNVVSVLFAGAFIGCLLVIPMSRYIGRKFVLMISCVVFIVGTIAQIAQTSDINYIYAGRVVAGVGIGMSASISPIYVAEISPKEIRGRLTSMFQQLLVIGALLAYFLTYAVSLHLPSENLQWRLVLGFQAIPSGLMLVCLFWAVESPRWLALKYRDDQGLASLAILRKRAGNDPIVYAEYAEICAQRDEEVESGATLKEFLLPGNRLRFCYGLGIGTFFIWCGHNSILYYGPIIFQSFGYKSGSAALLATGIFTCIKVGCSPIYVFFCSERYGRRTALLAGSFGQSVTLVIIGVLLSGHPAMSDIPVDTRRTLAAMLYLYVLIYSFTWGPINWVYTAEIFPPRLRQSGMAVSMGTRWVFNYVVAEVTPIALVNIGWKLWIILGCINCISLIFVYFLPETKGISLEATDVVFGTASATTRGRNVEKAADLLGRQTIPAIIPYDSV